MPPSSSFSRSGSIVNLTGIVLIVAASVIQALGFFYPLELRLLNTLRAHSPSRFLPEAPRVILISLENAPHGYTAMDVAMVLRGLKNFHPRCVAVNGLIELEEGTVPFLPPILSRMKEAGIALVMPQLPSPNALFQSVPVIRYSLSSGSNSWSILEGKATPCAGDPFFPSTTNYPASDSKLPLFATANDGVPVGSLWWWALPQELHQKPPLLLLGKILLLSNHTPLQLTLTGEANPTAGSILEIPLDDFLLQCEQKEQGTISPTFDTLWEKSTVVIGTHDDASKAAAFTSLLQATAWHHLSLTMQGAIALGWILLVLFIRNLGISAWVTTILILLFITALILFFLHLGIVLPYLSAIIAALNIFLNKR